MEAWRIKMELRRVKMELRRAYRPVVADFHHFDVVQGPDPYLSLKLDADLHLSEKLDADLHFSS
jgi:hypothetical protein